jgi:hypothetical protein
MGFGGGGLLLSQGLLEKRRAAYGKCLDVAPWSVGLKAQRQSADGDAGGDWVKQKPARISICFCPFRVTAATTSLSLLSWRI